MKTIFRLKKLISLFEPIYEIHFQNGYFDLNDLSFKKRELNKHHITKYIKRDYEKSTEQQRDEVFQHIKNIQ